jgi:hypothetical protein
MICTSPVNIWTFDRSLHGVKTVTAHGDGYSISLEWYRSYISPSNWDLFYNIYFSSVQSTIFTEGVKFIAPSNVLSMMIQDGFTPGSIYYFAVRASGHEPETLRIDEIPNINGFYMYPEAALRYNISATDLIIPLDDAHDFPSTGIVLIGAEPIYYSSVDYVDGYLILDGYDQRGAYGYEPRQHTTDGYDGYHYFDGIVRLWKGFEDGNNVIGLDENKFEFQYARTIKDGYRGRVDILSGTSNLDVVDAANIDFPKYDNTGWDRNSVADYIAGKCIGTYFGGEIGCSDSEEGVDEAVRGVSLQDQMNMREEYLLETTGEPVVLFKRKWNGKQSQHYDSTRENTTYRGLDNYGTSLVNGYEQYFNSRRSDGKILVRFGPTTEDLKREDPGIENTYIPKCWTLVIPSVQDGDFIIRFNKDGTEEWRYEIIDVERNRTTLEDSGLQKFTAVRVRKTDPIYQVRSFRDTSTMPSEILTGIGMILGPNGSLIPHIHRVVISEKILDVSQINQTTSTEQDHRHTIINGLCVEVLGHTHSLIMP